MFKVHRSYDFSTGVKNNSIAVINDTRTTKVIYHKTVVFEHTRNPCKSTAVITLRTNGWDTVSTRAVINRALENTGVDWRVVRKAGKSILKETNGLIMPLVSGMELHI